MKTKDHLLLEQAYETISNNKINEKLDSIDLELNPEAPSVEISDVVETHPHFSQEGNEEQEEKSMNETNLYTICKNAKMLMEIVKKGADLQTWMQQTLAIISDNLTSITQVAVYDFEKEMTMEAKEVNPYAVCTATVGREDEEKYKRCKEKVKKSAKKYGKKVTSKKIKEKKK